MRRAIAVVVVLVTTVGFGSTAAMASGGGGCGRPVTDARGETVRIKDFCFLPTVLRVRPGQAVTFANRDTFPHVVLGANAVWGAFSQVRGRHDVTYRFTRPGVYPYVCTYHAGMVGAIVVGGVAAHGEARMTATATGPVVEVPRASGSGLVRTDVATTATAPTPSTGRWVAPWQVIALAAVAVLVLGFARLEIRRQRAAIA